MKKITLVILAVMTALLFVSAGAYAGEMSGMSKSTHKASNLIGSAVINQQGDRLGKINDLVINAQDDRVTFAILSESRMLGLSERLIPVPINALTFKDEKTVVINISKEKLATAPSFDKGKWPDMTNRQWSEDTHRFYGVQPPWEERGMEKEGKSMKEGMMEKMEEKGMKEHMDKPKY